MKKIILLLIALTTISLSLALPVFAQDSNETTTTTLPSNETIDRDYLVIDDTVILSGTVNGDAYIAGESLTIDGTITNDLIAGGGNVIITGNIDGDVRAAGGNVTISGAQINGNITSLGGQINIDNATSVGGSVVAAGGNIQILSPITSGVNVAGGNVILGNSIGGDVNAAVGELSISNNAGVDGDLTYWSERDANIANNASISGSITKELPPRTETNISQDDIAAGFAGAFFMFRLIDTIMLLIIGLIIISMLPVYTNRVNEYIRSNVGISLLIGILGVILTPIIVGILMVTFFGIPLGVLLLILYLAMLWVTRIFVIMLAGEFILNKMNNKKGPKLTFTVGIVVYFIVSLLPIISAIVDLIVLLLGVGGFLVLKKKYYTELRAKKII